MCRRSRTPAVSRAGRKSRWFGPQSRLPVLGNSFPSSAVCVAGVKGSACAGPVQTSAVSVSTDAPSFALADEKGTSLLSWRISCAHVCAHMQSVCAHVHTHRHMHTPLATHTHVCAQTQPGLPSRICNVKNPVLCVGPSAVYETLRPCLRPVTLLYFGP